MSRIFVHGHGAVSPAGWGAAAMRAGLEKNNPLPVQTLSRPGWDVPLKTRLVPPPADRPAFMNQPRLRRCSPITSYSIGAALEAIGSDAELIRSGAFQIGIVVCTMTGGISFSRRFYEEVMNNPATASPMVFPETVFNAVASHLSALLGATTVNYTLVGDGGTFLQGLALAAQWLNQKTVEACVVIGAEESDWTSADALRLFDRAAIHTAGAGALYLKRERPATGAVELTAITDSFPPARKSIRDESILKMRAQLSGGNSRELLCPNENERAWDDWTGGKLTPQKTLGQAYAASVAWQCVAACDAIYRLQYEAANVSVTGLGWQTIGARFENPESKANPLQL